MLSEPQTTPYPKPVQTIVRTPNDSLGPTRDGYISPLRSRTVTREVAEANAVGHEHDRNPDLKHHVPLVRAVARRAAKAIDGDTDDLFGDAYLECLCVLGSYDPSASRVSTMVLRYGITRTIRRYMQIGKVKRRIGKTAGYADYPLTAAMRSGGSDGPAYHSLVRTGAGAGASGDIEGECPALTDEQCEVLTDREWHILRCYYGHNPMGLEQIGDPMGLTRERVRQIKNAALRKIWKVVDHESYDEACGKKGGIGNVNSSRAARVRRNQVGASVRGGDNRPGDTQHGDGAARVTAYIPYRTRMRLLRRNRALPLVYV